MHVLVIDDHPLFRHALASNLATFAGAVTTEAASCAEVFAAVRPEQRVDLILLDIVLAGENGLDQMSALRERFPAASIIVVSGAEDLKEMHIAIERGAQGYVPKSADNEVVRGAIRKVMDGGMYLPTLPFSRRWNDTKPAEASGVRDSTHACRSLTPRQQEVLEGIARGLSNKDIARQLAITKATVRTHVTQILKSLDVRNRTEAYAEAMARGLIKPPAPSR